MQFSFLNELTSGYRKAGITLLKRSVTLCRARPGVVTLKKKRGFSILCRKAVVGIFLVPLRTAPGLFQL